MKEAATGKKRQLLNNSLDLVVGLIRDIDQAYELGLLKPEQWANLRRGANKIAAELLALEENFGHAVSLLESWTRDKV